MASARRATLCVRDAEAADRNWIAELLAEQWGSTLIVSRGRRHRAERLPAFVALDAGARAGLLTYRIAGGEFEVVTLNATPPGRGAGSALLGAARRTAARAACRRLWLVTTNDNDAAIRFYERRGFSCVAVHEGGVELARRFKPGIPRVGRNGVPIRDELEFELRLGTAPTRQREG
ncbi:MAG: GNAT family N-acetyltransferase [Deltaproteobacteria bacterium]|nr:MAG: GNAT family N-acetyltransferase [Deltaproteobacteria bacterium]